MATWTRSRIGCISWPRLSPLKLFNVASAVSIRHELSPGDLHSVFKVSSDVWNTCLIPGGGSRGFFCLMGFAVVPSPGGSAFPSFDFRLVWSWVSVFVLALQMAGGVATVLDCSPASIGTCISAWSWSRTHLALISSNLRDDLWSRALRFCWWTSCSPPPGPHWNSSITLCREGKTTGSPFTCFS